MLEPIKVIVGEKVIEVKPEALWKYLLRGEDVTEVKAEGYELGGDTELLRIQKDYIAEMKPLIKVLDDYIIER